ncbi:hypothetical protein BBO99_00001524 [Phytophthora kernoviae]|uniref:Protein ENHANCED DISEASE RESISTANCE 2 C-terminal domain-containing protein n=2 Tax=Phytophthora kernoviae TaxID=325452 RepID=A0A421GZK0_9STRA|nr:hypothetical protein G195_003721 [Phytophthora kernoviae 00238/432]KAG2530126.1 hypothetical protein JM18_002396 [Phytophthora kernoviae]RLN20322.1 hypothetical protein BBI17_001347 [Phytophthora kernoviae]RLN84165.1 hypothetical protein BBO99_00001524 [Phytophthora kernoviae]
MWAEPTWSSFQLRSKTYLHSKTKETSAPPLFELLWFETFSGAPEELHHICKSKKSFASKLIAKFGNDIPPLFVVTLIVPGTPTVAGVQYFERLKLVPTVHDGPWLVRKSVGAKPLIISKALETTFYQTPAYLEVVVDICSDRIAKHVTALCRSHSTHLTVDVGYVIEGRDEAELPEALLGCVQYKHLDLTISTPIAD